MDGFIYVVSTPEYEKINQYKIGKWGSTSTDLLSRYRTTLINPIIYFYMHCNNNLLVEQNVLSKLDKYRVKNNNNRKSEWVKHPLVKISIVILEEINNIPIYINADKQVSSDVSIIDTENDTEDESIVYTENDTEDESIITDGSIECKTKCQICGKKFTTLSNLYQHQKNTKYCLEKAKRLMCKYCKKITIVDNHLEECLPYKKIELKRLQQKYDTLKKELEFKDTLLHKLTRKN